MAASGLYWPNAAAGRHYDGMAEPDPVTDDVPLGKVSTSAGTVALEQRDGAAVLRVTGALDLALAPRLRQLFERAVRLRPRLVVADMTGVETTFAAIAAETFGVTPDRVRVVYADTASAPFAGMSGGSKITYNIGRAVQKAAEETRERLLQVASDELEIAPDDLEIVDGVVRAVGAPDRSVPIEEIAAKSLQFAGRYEPIEGRAGNAHRSTAPAAAAHLAPTTDVGDGEDDDPYERGADHRGDAEARDHRGAIVRAEEQAPREPRVEVGAD